MKSTYGIVILLFSILFGEHIAQAKVCDEVLYVAYRGTGIFSANFDISDLQVDAIPYYFGAFCIDNKEKTLTYYPRRKEQFFNGAAQIAVRKANTKTSPPGIWLRFVEEYTAKGEGYIDKNGVEYFAPTDTALFPYWVGQYIGQRVGRIFRRDINAEPELDWVPNFTESRPFTQFVFGVGEKCPEVTWTDDKGRSGP